MSFYYPQVAVKLRILPEDMNLTSDAALEKTFEINVIPQQVSITINDYRTSNTFDMKLDYKSFPFDPRAIRACGVVIYIQDMEKLYDKHGNQAVIQPSAENAVFSGFIDTDQIDLDDQNRVVNFKGRDFTCLLIDQKYFKDANNNSPISLHQPIDVVIQELLNDFAATQQLKLINNTGGTLPTLAEYYPDAKSPLVGMRSAGGHDTYWEIIQDICTRAGLICYMDLDQLILTTPRNQANTIADDIQFIYGENIKSFQVQRKLGRFKNFNIQVTSRDQKNVIRALIPEDADPTWCKQYGIAKEPVYVPNLKPDGTIDNTQSIKAPYITFPIPHIANKDQLVKIGQTIYEQYSLQQLEGKLTTHEMLGRGLGSDPVTDKRKTFTKFDLTQIRKGQTICIEITTDDLDKITRMKTVGAREHYLIKRNYAPEVAAIFAKTLGRFSPRFQIKSYMMQISESQGFQLDINFQNVLNLKQVGLV